MKYKRITFDGKLLYVEDKVITADAVFRRVIDNKFSVSDTIKSFKDEEGISLTEDDVKESLYFVRDILAKKPHAPQEHNFAFDMWNDSEFKKIVKEYETRRTTLERIAKEKEIFDYDSNVDTPPHIRNWFENPVYQMLVKPSMSRVRFSYSLSMAFTTVVFLFGVILLILGLVFAVLSKMSIDQVPAVVTLILSGTASIVASLFRAINILRDTATQYAKLQIAISAGMVSVDALQRIVGHQEVLNHDEHVSVQEITKALAPLIKAFEESSKSE